MESATYVTYLWLSVGEDVTSPGIYRGLQGWMDMYRE